MVGELINGEIREYEIHPEDFGLQMVSNRSLRVNDAGESKQILIEALENHEFDPLGVFRRSDMSCGKPGQGCSLGHRAQAGEAIQLSFRQRDPHPVTQFSQ